LINYWIFDVYKNSKSNYIYENEFYENLFIFDFQKSSENSNVPTQDLLCLKKNKFSLVLFLKNETFLFFNIYNYIIYLLYYFWYIILDNVSKKYYYTISYKYYINVSMHMFYFSQILSMIICQK